MAELAAPRDSGAWLEALLVPHRIVMAVLFLGGLLVGWLLLPGERERIAALERDGQFRQALELLEARFDQGDRSQRSLFQLQRLYEHFGDLAKSRSMLEMLVGLRPRDVHVRRRLAQFYKATQDEPSYVAALMQELEIGYSEPACRELIGLFRRNGDYDRELALLTRCTQKGYRRAEDIIRLAHLLAADGKTGLASDLLIRVDDRRRLKTESDRLFLFATLMEAERADEAQKRGVRWLKAARDDSLALALVETLMRENRHGLAIELVKQISAPGDSVSLAVAEIMLDRGEETPARSYLRGWLSQAQIKSAGIVSRFIVAALDAVDPDLAFTGAKSFGLARVPQIDLASLAEALATMKRTAEFAEVRAAIVPKTIDENPLLAAAIDVSNNAMETARQQLLRVPVDDLDEWRLALWAQLMEQTGTTAAATALSNAGVDQSAMTQSQRIVRREGPAARRTTRRGRLRMLPPAKAGAPKQLLPQGPPPPG